MGRNARTMQNENIKSGSRREFMEQPCKETFNAQMGKRLVLIAPDLMGNHLSLVGDV